MNILNFILLVTVTVFLSLFVYETQYADAALYQTPDHCYATLSETGRTIQGIKSELKTPDMFIKNDSTCKNNSAVAANWIQFRPQRSLNQWLEVGIATGGFEIHGNSDKKKCITTQQAYYAYQYIFGIREIYREIEISDRLDPRDDIRLEISKPVSTGNTWKITLKDLETGITYNPLQTTFTRTTVVDC